MAGFQSKLVSFFVISLLLSIAFVSCTGHPDRQEKSDSLQPQQGLVIHRYEKALFNLSPDHLRSGLGQIYPEFRFFMGDSWQDTMNLLRIYNFITDTTIRHLYDLDMQKYPDLTFLSSGLEQAFRKIGDLQPGFTAPTVYTYVSGLDVEKPVIYTDSAMAISLDLFLGKEEQAYSRAGIPLYMTDRFSREHLLPECIKSVGNSWVSYDENKQSLIDQMIAAGKVLYFLDLVLPDQPDELKIGYSKDKLKWCTSNERNIWSFLVANQLLFSSDPKIVGKLMVDAPFTSGFVNESPGRLGEWVGWQIIRAYMRANPGILLPDLMKNTDAYSILQGSGYKPS